MSIITHPLDKNQSAETKKSIIHIKEKNSDPLIEYINQVLAVAIAKNASDIHFEPYQETYRIRIRVNGLLEQLKATYTQLDKRIAARLKTFANLDTTERRLPQDGQLQVEHEGRLYNLRISTCPTIYGEKIVLRILYHHQHHDIDALGMTQEQKKNFLKALKKPQGLILVCGPTGSGKTVTLYAALDYLNKPGINIVTVEDPVEIHLSGINQVAVNSSIKLNFQRTLRSFLRQDPDIIMVGEIRDSSTAKITIKAAQTGHLVLSTVHSNSALKALIRLRHMGIAAYDLIDSISLLMAQRLLRKLCVHCKKTYVPDAITCREFQLEPSLQIYQPIGCNHCQQGYQNRFAIFEVIPFNEKMIHAILSNSSIFELEQSLPELGTNNLRYSAAQALKQGLTSIEEIKRVILSS